jgi:glycosyl hydrolase family 79
LALTTGQAAAAFTFLLLPGVSALAFNGCSSAATTGRSATGGAVGTSTGGIGTNTGGRTAAAGTGGAKVTGAPDAGNAGSSETGTGGGAVSGTGGAATGGQSGGVDAGTGAAPDAGTGTMAGGPVFTGPTTDGTVTVNRSTAMGRLVPGFVGFSFEKTHMTDQFFTGANAPLIAMFKLLGPGLVRIGADDVDNTSWLASAAPTAGNGMVSSKIGTADVDSLANFLTASGWKTIYGVSIRAAEQTSVDESAYVTSKLGSSLHSIEIGNEINFFGANTIVSTWEMFETAIRARVPNVPLAGPAAAADLGFTTSFAQTEGSKLLLLTYHYYKAASSSNPTIAQMLALDTSLPKNTQTLAAAAQTNKIADGFRWAEMNSYSGHGAAGVSDVYASALWSIDFMLTTAMYGSMGVNFHGGGQNMDGNNCPTGPQSCTKPFRYSPIDEVNSQVTAAAPLFYGMLFVSHAGTGNMYPTTAKAGNLNFTGYAIALADGSTNVVLVNKDATNGVKASVDTGAAVTSADASYLLAPALNAKTGITFAGSDVSPTGDWTPQLPYALTTNGNVVSVLIPPGSAVIVHAQ